jgi:hypothetical protein
VIVGGSHAAIYAGYLCVKARARAAITNDAGIGLDEAGVGGLIYAQRHGMAMAAVSAMSARIGDAQDMLKRGIISRANALAEAVGVSVGMDCSVAATCLLAAQWPPRQAEPVAEGRESVDTGSGRRQIVVMGSFSAVLPEDAGRIVISGSHAGAPSGRTGQPIRMTLALFNDAGIGIDNAGVAGLAILAEVGTPAAAVAASTARIGDGGSTWRDGVISVANGPAISLGARVGERALDLVSRLVNNGPR